MSDPIIRILSEISSRLGSVESRLDTTNMRLDAIEKADQRQNDLIEEHIKGVETNLARLELEKQFRSTELQKLHSKVDNIDQNPIKFKHLQAYLIKSATIAGAITAIITVYKLLF